MGYAVLTRRGREILREALESAEMISEEVIGPKAASRLAEVEKFLGTVSVGPPV